MTDIAARDDAPFNPDWVSPPGDTIQDLLEEKGWTQAEFSRRLGYTEKHVSLLINGKVPLTEEGAVRLQNVLGGSLGFWLAREAQYREHLAARDAMQSYAQMVDWLDRVPVRDLMNLSAIPKRRIDERSKPALVGELLSFFGVASAAQWETHYASMEGAFRRSRADQSDIGAISAWLRMGEREAEKFDGPKYSERVFRPALQEIRSFTVLGPEEFLPRLRSLLTEAGVALVLVPAIPRAHVSGVARWLNAHRPLIQMSLYGKTNDRFWFTFFHEAAHILLHASEKRSVYLDDPSGATEDSPYEQEANDWARDFLIPQPFAARLRSLGQTRAAVQAFAREIGIHPGIVVGRLQHEGLLPMTWLNALKARYEFRKS
jgi:HTH-type transcriptional regulator/antitoxin HigA